MNKTATITRHEFITTVRRRMYLIFTLALPLIAVIIMLGGQALGGAPGPPARAEQIGYVDMAGVVTGFNAQGNVSFVPYTSQAEANAALLDGRVESYIVIPAGYISTGLVQRFTTSRELDKGAAIQSATASFLVENLLNGKTGPDIITRVQAPVSLTSTLLTATGEVAPNQGAGSFLVPYFFSLLLLMSIFFSSSYLLQGLGEEKENRVMEILLSSVSARQLLAGKTLGLGAAGLLQILVWLFSARFLASYASGTFGAAIGQISIPPGLIVIGVIYFVLGYLLFAVLMAGVGAITPTAREGQQMSALFSIAAVIPIFFMTVIIEHPEGVVPLVLSYIPLTAPITMIMRAGSMSIPAWQVAVSAAILMATIAGCFVLAAKLFRTFLLMYGKRAELKDILRSFRSA